LRDRSSPTRKPFLCPPGNGPFSADSRLGRIIRGFFRSHRLNFSEPFPVFFLAVPRGKYQKEATAFRQRRSMDCAARGPKQKRTVPSTGDHYCDALCARSMSLRRGAIRSAGRIAQTRRRPLRQYAVFYAAPSHGLDPENPRISLTKQPWQELAA